MASCRCVTARMNTDNMKTKTKPSGTLLRILSNSRNFRRTTVVCAFWTPLLGGE